MKGKVYLLIECGNEESDRYKIGITKNDISIRISTLQTGNPKEIRLVESYESVNYKKIERILHRLYAVNHEKGEWFVLDFESVKSFLSEAKKADETISFLLKNNHFYN